MGCASGKQGTDPLPEPNKNPINPPSQPTIGAKEVSKVKNDPPSMKILPVKQQPKQRQQQQQKPIPPLKVDKFDKQDTNHQLPINQSGRPAPYVPDKYLKVQNNPQPIQQSPINIIVSSSNPEDQLKGIARRQIKQFPETNKSISVNQIKIEAKQEEKPQVEQQKVARQLKFQEQKQKQIEKTIEKTLQKPSKQTKKINWAEKDQVNQIQHQQTQHLKPPQNKKLEAINFKTQLIR